MDNKTGESEKDEMTQVEGGGDLSGIRGRPKRRGSLFKARPVENYILCNEDKREQCGVEHMQRERECGTLSVLFCLFHN